MLLMKVLLKKEQVDGVSIWKILSESPCGSDIIAPVPKTTESIILPIGNGFQVWCWGNFNFRIHLNKEILLLVKLLLLLLLLLDKILPGNSHHIQNAIRKKWHVNRISNWKMSLGEMPLRKITHRTSNEWVDPPREREINWAYKKFKNENCWIQLSWKILGRVFGIPPFFRCPPTPIIQNFTAPFKIPNFFIAPPPPPPKKIFSKPPPLMFRKFS